MVGYAHIGVSFCVVWEPLASHTDLSEPLAWHNRALCLIQLVSFTELDPSPWSLRQSKHTTDIVRAGVSSERFFLSTNEVGWVLSHWASIVWSPHPFGLRPFVCDVKAVSFCCRATLWSHRFVRCAFKGRAREREPWACGIREPSAFAIVESPQPLVYFVWRYLFAFHREREPCASVVCQ